MTLSNAELVIGFCSLYEDLFAAYIEHVHEIEPTETETIFKLLREEVANGLHQGDKKEQQDRGSMSDRIDVHAQNAELKEVATVRPLRRDSSKSKRVVCDMPV